MRPEGVTAVTADAYGTLIELRDPVPELRAALAAADVERPAAAVGRAFRAEVAHYVPRAHLGRDEPSLAALRLECVGVFLRHLAAPVEPSEFVAPFLATLRYEVLPGVEAALKRLADAGLVLACVANWDASLPETLMKVALGERLAVAVSSAEAGAPKPDPRIFRLALERLGVAPEHALHVGDDAVDRDGARAAGLAFEPAPLVTLPARLGLDR